MPNVDRLHGLEVPGTLADACRPERLALLVYDMQEGILGQIDDRERVVGAIAEVLQIARDAGVRTLFTRHVTMPVELMGAEQLRMIGIEPTVRHAGDIGFVSVVITDACAAGDAAAGARSLETLAFLGDTMLTDVAGFRAAVAGS